MAIHDAAYGGYRIFVGDLGRKVLKEDLEKAFEIYGRLLDVWVARNPPGCAFVLYKYPEDAEKAVEDMEGRTVCGRRIRVEHARPFDPNAKSRKPIHSQYSRDHGDRSDLRHRHAGSGSRGRGLRSWDQRSESRSWLKVRRRSPPSRYLSERYSRKRSSGHEWEGESWDRLKRRRSAEHRDRSYCQRRWRPEREDERWERSHERREGSSRSDSGSRKVPTTQPRSEVGAKVTTKTDSGCQTDDLLTAGESSSADQETDNKTAPFNVGNSKDKESGSEEGRNEEHRVVSVSIGTDTLDTEIVVGDDAISNKGEKRDHSVEKEMLSDKLADFSPEKSSEKTSNPQDSRRNNEQNDNSRKEYKSSEKTSTSPHNRSNYEKSSEKMSNLQDSRRNSDHKDNSRKEHKSSEKTSTSPHSRSNYEQKDNSRKEYKSSDKTSNSPDSRRNSGHKDASRKENRGSDNASTSPDNRRKSYQDDNTRKENKISENVDRFRDSLKTDDGKSRSDSGASGQGGVRFKDGRHKPMQVEYQHSTKDQGCGPDTQEDNMKGHPPALDGGGRHRISVVLKTSKLSEAPGMVGSGSGSSSKSTSSSGRRRNWSEDSDSDLSDDDTDQISIGMGGENGGESPKAELDKRVVVSDVSKDKWVIAKEQVIHKIDQIADIPIPAE